jgi:hypothetical protein
MRIERAAALMGALAILSTSIAQAASDEFNAHIVMVRVDATDDAIITFDKVPAGKPTCATYDSGKALTADLATNSGRELFRLATAAYLAGKTVRFVGAGTCTIHSNKEDLSSLHVSN